MPEFDDIVGFINHEYRGLHIDSWGKPCDMILKGRGFEWRYFLSISLILRAFIREADWKTFMHFFQFMDIQFKQNNDTVLEKDILNIDYHRQLLILTALNRYPTQKEAAAKVGLTTRQLYRLIKRYDFVQDGENKTWSKKQHHKKIFKL